MKYFCSAIAGLAALASAASAQDFRLVGGEVGGGYNSVEIDSLSGNFTDLFGSTAFTITPNFGIQAGVSYKMFDFLDATAANLHGYYRTAAGGKFGIFTSYESFSDIDENITSYGLEGMFAAGPVTYEFRAGTVQLSNSDETFDFAGANLYYAAMTNLDVTAAAEYTRLDSSFDITELSLGADYYVSDSIKIGASFGHLTFDSPGPSESGTTARIQVSYLFGGRGERLFQNQGALDSLLSFGP